MCAACSATARTRIGQAVVFRATASGCFHGRAVLACMTADLTIYTIWFRTIIMKLSKQVNCILGRTVLSRGMVRVWDSSCIGFGQAVEPVSGSVSQ